MVWDGVGVASLVVHVILLVVVLVVLVAEMVVLLFSVVKVVVEVRVCGEVGNAVFAKC